MLPRPYFDVHSKSRTAALMEEAKVKAEAQVKNADPIVAKEITSSETNGKADVSTVVETKNDTLLDEQEHGTEYEANEKIEVPVRKVDSPIQEDSVVSSG
jgi:hypothetical protein